MAKPSPPIRARGLHKLAIPAGQEDHRRVLAVLAYLGGTGGAGPGRPAR